MLNKSVEPCELISCYQTKGFKEFRKNGSIFLTISYLIGLFYYKNVGYCEQQTKNKPRCKRVSSETIGEQITKYANTIKGFGYTLKDYKTCSYFRTMDLPNEYAEIIILLLIKIFSIV